MLNKQKKLSIGKTKPNNMPNIQFTKKSIFEKTKFGSNFDSLKKSNL